MLEQMEALFLLKLALLRNRLRRGQFLPGLFAALTVISSALGSAVMFAIFFVIGLKMAASRPLDFVLLLSDVVVLFYILFIIIGFLVELQVSEIIDFRKMLYLPISLRMVFLMNMGISLITPSSAFMVSAVAGFVLGSSFPLGAAMLAGLLFLPAFLWMIGAWLYFARSWVAEMLENKRRRRAVAAAAGLLIILITQAPNLVFNIGGRRQSRWEYTSVQKTPYYKKADDMRGFWLGRGGALEDANRIIPFGWLPLGLSSISRGEYGTASASLLGMALLGLAGYSLGYRATLRYHSGGGAKGAVASDRKTGSVRPAPPRTPATLRGLPFLDEQTSAVAAASFLSFVRHPQLRIHMVMPIVFILIAAAAAGIRKGGQGPATLYLMSAAAALMPFLGSAGVLWNAFGTDMAGFRAFVLSPVSRSRILMGKNLAVLPIVALPGTLFLVLLSFFFHFGAAAFVLAMLAAAQMFIMQCAIGNFCSIFFPYPCRFDQVQDRNVSNRKLLGGLLSWFLTGLSLVPVMLLHFSPLILLKLLSVDAPLICVAASAIFLLILTAAYRATIGLSSVFLEGREMKILQELADKT